MNPLKWIRWKVVIVLAVVAGGFYLLGLNPLARREVNDLGTGQHGARWQVSQLDLGLLSGDFDFLGFLLAAPHSKEKDQVFSSDKIRFDFDMDQLLRKRLHGQVNVEVPKLTLERRPDGTINVGEIGEEKPRPPEEKPSDWVGAVREWAKKLKKWEEKRREWQKSRKEPKKEEAKKEKVDTATRVTYPFERIARFAAQKISGRGFEIEFRDAAGGQSIPPLKNGELSIENLSDNPTCYHEPVRWTLKGEIAGAPLELSGHLDLRSDPNEPAAEPKNELRFDIKADGLPLELANLFAGSSLPVHFEKEGKLKLSAEVTVLEVDRLNIQPRLGFIDAKVAPNPGVKTIAGFDAHQFCKAFNEVGTFELNDIAIGGTFTAPEIKLGNTLQELVSSGGASFAKKQAQKAIEKGAEKLEEKLKKAGADKGLDDQTKKILEGATKGAGEKILKGILGGEKKSDPPPPPKDQGPK
ncbi:MAG: hypothetical protein HY717_01785 [Planctomycetes bacterium]|nr:hypothetical protein [Planctomycetota bacterium]